MCSLEQKLKEELNTIWTCKNNYFCLYLGVSEKERFCLYRYVTAFLELVRRSVFVTSGKAFWFTTDSRQNLRDYCNLIMEKLRGKKRQKEKEREEAKKQKTEWASNIFVDEDSDLLLCSTTQ
jgi:hypothetical protein